MQVTEAFVFDAISSPRGRGRSNGSLYTTKPIDLIVGLMHEMLSRNPELDATKIDDVVMGCVTPIGDQGATSRAPRRSRRGCRTRSPACRSTASAPRRWRPSTSPR